MTALITGASSGIGLELARIFAANGHDLVVVARSEDKLRALARECEASGVCAHVSAADLGADGRLLRNESVRAVVQRGDCQ